MPLAEHDLLAFRMLQIDELFLFTPVGNLKTDDVLPEREADLHVGNMKLRYDFGPARFRRSVPVGTHIDNFLAAFLSSPIACTRKSPHSGVIVAQLWTN